MNAKERGAAVIDYIRNTLNTVPEYNRGPQFYVAAQRLLLTGKSERATRKILLDLNAQVEPPRAESLIWDIVARVYRGARQSGPDGHRTQFAPHCKTSQPIEDPADKLLEQFESNLNAVDDPDQEEIKATGRGWIKLHRKIRDHWLWPNDRKYTHLEAWADLLLSANHKPTKIRIDFKLLPIARGQHLTSQVKLADRWRWDRETVNKFLNLLKSDNMIDMETSKRFTVVTIRNYDKYQGITEKTASNRTSNENDNNTSTEQQQNPQQRSIKKNDQEVREGRKIRESAPKTTLPKDFALSVEMKDFATAKGLSPEGEFEKFQAHYIGKGVLAADWSFMWRRWILNALQFERLSSNAEEAEPVRKGPWARRL